MRRITASRHNDAAYDDNQSSIKLFGQRAHTSTRPRESITSVQVRELGVERSSCTTLRLGSDGTGALGFGVRCERNRATTDAGKAWVGIRGEGKRGK